MKHLFVCLLVAGALAAPAAADTPPHVASTPDAGTRTAKVEQIVEFRAETWRWQTLMRTPRTPAAFSERRFTDADYLEWVRDLWRRRAAQAERLAANPPHRKQWLCIHRYERDPRQGWRTRTGNGYYGGLQMDLDFQRAYAPAFLRRKGTADSWTPVEQMWVAERAYRSGRGFRPWPNTARYCGLL